MKRFGAKKGAWAVVTGASDGIGKEFSFQLARAGFNVLLVARNQQLLASTALEIGTILIPLTRTAAYDYSFIVEKKYPGVSTATHSIDFSQNDEAAYRNLAAAFDGLDIGVLGV